MRSKLFLSLLALIPLFSACGNNNVENLNNVDPIEINETPTPDDQEKGDKEDEEKTGENDNKDEENLIYSHDLIITEFRVGTFYKNRSIEISNIGEDEINLQDYSILVFRNYNTTPTEEIKLGNNVINPHSSFVISYSGADQSILDKTNLTTEKFLNDGTFPIALAYKDKIIDTVGKPGFIYDFAKSAVLVRKKEYFKQNPEFNNYERVRYPVNSLKTLGNIDVISEKDLLNGPKLTQSDIDKDFCDNSAKGNGGTLEVSYLYNIDGDTTKFNYGSQYASFDVSGSLSTRYYGINTPEIAHSAGESPDPYGNEAKDFTASILNNSKHFIVQSISGYSLHETYGRMLGYVWVSNKENPEPEDYQLLNYLIIKNGFSDASFITRDAEYNSEMLYKGVSYIEFLYDAQNYATVHELNIHSKK